MIFLHYVNQNIQLILHLTTFLSTCYLWLERLFHLYTTANLTYNKQVLFHDVLYGVWLKLEFPMVKLNSSVLKLCLFIFRWKMCWRTTRLLLRLSMKLSIWRGFIMKDVNMGTDLLQLMWTIFYEIKSIQNLKLATEKFRIIHPSI